MGVAIALPPPALAASPECPNEATRAASNVDPATGRPYSTELPDCRAYELVTREKNDYDALASFSVSSYALGAGDGGSLVWDAPYAGPYGQPSNGTGDVHRAVREASACVASQATCWPLSTLAPSEVAGGEYFTLAGASSDLSTVLLRSVASDVVGLEAPEGLSEAGPAGCCTTIAADMPADSKPVAHVSGDGSHVFFQTHARLVSEDTHGPVNGITEQPEGNQVYEWTRAGGLRLAGVDSEGAATSACGATLASSGLSRSDVSRNGARVVFLSPDPGIRSAPSECRLGPIVEGRTQYVSDLYVRENGSTTVDVSGPPVGVADYGAEFVGATPDGSTVFFVSASALTPDKAHSGPGYSDLYEYDVETGVLRRLSVGQEEADLTGFNGSPSSSAIVSSDGSHVYFTALGQLVPGAGRSRRTNEEDCEGHGPGSATCTANLYLYTSGRVSFIANLEPGTFAGLYGAYHAGEPSPPLGVNQAAVTPDGTDLVFETNSNVTTYNSDGHGELYRFDAPSATISCVSCSPAGVRAEGLSYLHASPPSQVAAEFAGAPVEQLGGLSRDGSTVFFAATDRLLSAAINADPAAENPIIDVYEWHDGVLSLISTGASASPDTLLGASPDGSNVFFATASQLVAQDGDHAIDIYDARVGGGFGAPPAPPTPCTAAETCRSMAATPPAPVAPASMAFTGPGDSIVLPINGPTHGIGLGHRPTPKRSCRAKAKSVRNAKKRRQALARCPKPKHGGGRSGATSSGSSSGRGAS
jgi:hypothetical protein